MIVTLTWQTLITAAAVITAIGVIVGFVVKAVKWFDRQSKQDSNLDNLSNKHDEDINSLKAEQRIIIEGLLACLQGLQEQGCNGPVTKAVEKIGAYLNGKAHE